MNRKLRPTSIPILAIILIIGIVVVPMQTTTAAGPVVNVWMTTSDQSQLLTAQPSLTFAPDSGSNPLTVSVNPATRYQQMDGWGASFTDSSAWLAWYKLSASARNAMMNDLFNKNSGIGLSFLRQPMGATDLSASGNYSYDDGAADPNLNNFSIGHDLTYIIPILQQALSINPSLKIMANPWSPPGWMKTSGSMIGGNLLSAQYSNALAQYFVKFIQAYQAQGIPVYAITVQNEPLYIPAGYPGMGMAAADQGGFIGYNLGPALAGAGLNTKIIVYDHNWDQISYPTTVYSNSAAYPYAAGVGWHCYGGDISTELTFHNNYPSKDTWLTECSGGSWESNNNFGSDLKSRTETLMILNARNWGKGAIFWNMALDTNNGPTNGGCTTCRGVVTIDQTNGTYAKTVDYYVLGQASKFVDSGAYRIDTNSFGSSSIEDVAFQNPDGTDVVLALNNNSSAQTFKVLWNGQSVSYNLPAGAVATFKWNPSIVESPYLGSPAPIPGQIEAENYDNGGQNVAYNDTTPGNSGGQYRGDDVDIESTTDTGGGYDVGWTATSEWEKYMVNVTSAGNYNIAFRVASPNTGSALHLEVDGNNITGSMTVPNTGGWQAWQTITASGKSLTAGNHTLRLYIDNGGMNINWVKFSVTSGGPPTNTPIPSPTFTNTPIPSSTPTHTPTPTGGISSSSWYNVINQNSGKCVDAAGWGTTNGTIVQQWTCGNAQNNQEWQFQPTDSGYYRVLNRNAQSLVWDVTGGSGATTDGIKIQLWTWGGGSNQQWMPVTLGGGYYQFVARNSGTECLDVTNNSTADGVQLQQWTCGSGDLAQSFRLAQQP